jgi:hypothetical protein
LLTTCTSTYNQTMNDWYNELHNEKKWYEDHCYLPIIQILVIIINKQKLQRVV